MTSAHALSIDSIWQQWERRIVNARFPLLQYIGGSRHSAFYVTEIGRSKAALKLIPAGTVRAAVQVAGWKLAAPLSHPNLVKIVETGLWHADQEQDMQFVVMEYCEESLDVVLRQRPLTPAEARQMLLPTLNALRYLHSHGLVHGHVKPAHILAIGDQLKLSSDTLYRNGESRPGTIETPYDAPERATGAVSPSGDIWSLGITLFEVLTGHLPGAGKHGDAKAAEKLPSPFNLIVAGCLTRESERRISLSAIGSFLEKSKESDAEVNAVVPSAAKLPSNITVLPVLPSASEPRIEKVLPISHPDRVPTFPSATRPIPNREGAASLRKKKTLTLAAILAALGVLLVVWLAQKKPRTESTTATSVAQPSHANAITPKSVDADRTPTTSSGAVLHPVMPAVSNHARNTINGTVTVKVRLAVNPEGQVTRASLVAKGPSAYFSRQTLQSAQQWTFAPPVRDGRPQSSDWMLVFEFRRSGTTVHSRMATRP